MFPNLEKVISYTCKPKYFFVLVFHYKFFMHAKKPKTRILLSPSPICPLFQFPWKILCLFGGCNNTGKANSRHKRKYFNVKIYLSPFFSCREEWDTVTEGETTKWEPTLWSKVFIVNKIIFCFCHYGKRNLGSSCHICIAKIKITLDGSEGIQHINALILSSYPDFCCGSSMGDREEKKARVRLAKKETLRELNQLSVLKSFFFLTGTGKCDFCYGIFVYLFLPLERDQVLEEASNLM